MDTNDLAGVIQNGLGTVDQDWKGGTGYQLCLCYNTALFTTLMLSQSLIPSPIFVLFILSTYMPRLGHEAYKIMQVKNRVDKDNCFLPLSQYYKQWLSNKTD